jgi:hypothetical protein
MDEQTTQKRGYKKYSEPKRDPNAKGFRKYSEPKAKPDPNAKGYKKFLAKAKDWDGTFASSDDDALSINRDVLKNFEREGVALKWVRESVYGWQDDKNIARHKKNGWQYVEPGDFDDITVTREGGLTLMARPLAIEKKARANAEHEATAPIRVMKERAGEGAISDKITLDSKHSSARNYNKIRSTGYERIEIPQDE